MAGTLIVSNLKTDTDNTFIVRSNTGTTLFVANTTGIDVANSIGATAITNDKILSVANTKITGNIISSQIASVNGSVITANTIANSAIQTGAVENYMRGASLDFGMRNRIINGAMVINQRGASVTSSGYTVDRFQYVASVGSKGTLAQSTSIYPTGFNYSLGFTSSSAYSVGASELFAINQTIEGYNIADLGWGTANAKTVTLSFWVRSSLTGTFGGSLSSYASTRSYPFTYTISTANTWEQKSITVAGDTTGTWYSDNNAGMNVWFGLGVGSTVSGTAETWAGTAYYSATGATSVVGTNGATFYITGVQLEKGSTATSFEYRSYGPELALCQRYCFSITGNSGEIVGIGFTGTTVAGTIGVAFPVEMRTSPTLVSSLININDSQAQYTGSAVALAYAGTPKFNALSVTITGGTVGRGCQGYWAASSSKAVFSSEL